MAKKSQINRNAKREKMVEKFAAKRAALKAITEDMNLPPEERFAAHLKLAKLPRNSSNAHSSPLRAFGPPEGVLPQGEDVAYRAA